uniref:Transposase n=1 Tax=Klebsiella sp. D5050 TaxID=1497792 RepID=A0A0P0YQF6_9ENTR|nr:transposase [Klebsiella sp. D5050]
MTSLSARKWTNSGATSGLNHVSAGYFTPMTGCAGRVAHVFGERTLATLERLLELLSVFDVVVWMTDGWPLYESRLKGKLHVISKRYTQRIERHNLNLRQHLARLGRKSLSFSKSVELHDKVIGHYLNIKHYQ